MRRLLREQEQTGAVPVALTIYATRIPVPARTLTGLTAVVQLHLRVAIGLQALQRCSGLLNRRARGSTVATHHFMLAWLSSDSSSFVNCRAIRPTGVRVSPSAPFYAPVAARVVQQKRHDVESVASAGAMLAVRKHLPRAPTLAR